MLLFSSSLIKVSRGPLLSSSNSGFSFAIYFEISFFEGVMYFYLSACPNILVELMVNEEALYFLEVGVFPYFDSNYG